MQRRGNGSRVGMSGEGGDCQPIRMGCRGIGRVQIDGACLSLGVVLTAAVKNRTESPTTRKKGPPVFGAQSLVSLSGASRSARRSLLGLDQSQWLRLGV